MEHHKSQKCSTHLPTVKCVMSNCCECQASNRPCTGSCPLDIFCNTGRQPPPLRDVAGWYKSDTHEKHENIPPKKPPKFNCITTNLLLGCPPNHLTGQQSDLLPDRLERGRGQTLSSGERRCRSSYSVTHWDRDSYPQVLHTNGDQRRQSQFKPHPNNEIIGSGTPCRHWQCRHVSRNFWREWKKIDSSWVERELAQNREYHSGYLGPHQGNRKHPQGS